MSNKMPVIELISIDSIQKNPDNPRIIKDDKFKKLVKSVKSFPEMLRIRPIVINSEMMILGGNMRYEACKSAGLKEIPIIKADNLTEEQKREFIIKDNVSGGEWDWEELANNWDKELLDEWGLDFPLNVNLDSEDDNYIATDVNKNNIDIVEQDLIEIGRHRLMCGDCTISTNVSKLLCGKEPYLMVTDPPYGVNYDPEWRTEAGINKKHQKIASSKVENDDRCDWSEAWALSPSSVAYIWHGGLHSSVVAQSLEKNNYQIRSQIIWTKPSLVMGRGHYHWRHEPCWYAVKKGNSGNWAGDRKQSTVWEIENMHVTQGNIDDGKTDHATQKPVECMARPIRNHDGDVYDPFLGSGTTMVACEQLGRKCYAFELSPYHCQIIIDRMKKLVPEIEIKINGVKYGRT